MTCHYNRSQPVSALVVNRLMNGLVRCMRSCETFERTQAEWIKIISVISRSELRNQSFRLQ